MFEIITDSDANYAFDLVKKICSEVGPGLPGSSQEYDRADFEGWISSLLNVETVTNPAILTVKPFLNVLRLTLEWIKNDI